MKTSDAEYCKAWMTLVGDRFKPGDRVVFSKWAYRNGLTTGRKGGAKSGTVVAVKGKLSVEVLLDGYKRPQTFHHMFFIPAREAGN